MSIELFEGDCMEIFPQIHRPVRAVITDPPYMINTKSDGSGKISPWADLCNAAAWYASWLSEAKKHLTEDGCLWCFFNWRGLPTLQKASCDIRWPIESLLVWNKNWPSASGLRGLRSSYEVVALFCMPGFRIEDRSLKDVQTFPWSATKPHGHPAEKPEALVRWLIEISTTGGGILCSIRSWAPAQPERQPFVPVEILSGQS